MVFKIAIAIVAVAAIASAAKVPRVACSKGKYASHDACCAFLPLLDDLQKNIFFNECGDVVQDALRLSFHDAIGFSKSGKFKGNGADGSMIVFRDIETNFSENAGIIDAVDELLPAFKRHKVTAGDFIQFANAVGLTNCPGAPRIQFLAGRPDPVIPADDGTVPRPEQDADTIFERMADGGFTPAELVHLLASHTIAGSDTLVPGHEDVPFDSTPFTFDTQFYLEVMLKGVGVPFGVNNSIGAEVDSPIPESGEMRLQSDFVISRDNRTACEWQSMVLDQQLMMTNFKSAMEKLAVVGQDIASLIDCSDIIPQPKLLKKKVATLPAGTSSADIQQVCPAPFPSVAADPGQPTQIPHDDNGAEAEDDHGGKNKGSKGH